MAIINSTIAGGGGGVKEGRYVINNVTVSPTAITATSGYYGSYTSISFGTQLYLYDDGMVIPITVAELDDNGLYYDTAFSIKIGTLFGTSTVGLSISGGDPIPFNSALLGKNVVLYAKYKGKAYPICGTAYPSTSLSSLKSATYDTNAGTYTKTQGIKFRKGDKFNAVYSTDSITLILFNYPTSSINAAKFSYDILSYTATNLSIVVS